MNIRQVRPDDLPAIHALHLAAFGDEGQSVADRCIRQRCPWWSSPHPAHSHCSWLYVSR
jgi:hypothetical protein